MLAPRCDCARPQAFDDSETCTKCGRIVALRVSRSTWETAMVIAAVYVGSRRAGDERGRNRRDRDPD